jgi:hypothetical protein
LGIPVDGTAFKAKPYLAVQSDQLAVDVVNPGSRKT